MAADPSAAGNGAGSSNGRPAGPPAPSLTVRNETARRVTIKGDDVKIVLPPFAEKELSSHQLRRIDTEALRGDPHVDLPEADDPQPYEDELPVALALSPLFVIGVPIWAIAGVFIGGSSYWWIGAVALAALSLLTAITVKVLQKRRASPNTHQQPKEPGAFGRWVSNGAGWATQQLYLSANIAIGLLVPAAVIVFTAELLDVIDVMRTADAGTDLHDHVLTLVGRGLQIVFIAVVSLLPALLFFLFDREQLDTLRDRFMRQIVRFDGTVETRTDILAKYGKAMDEAYGHERVGEGRLLPGRRSPVLVATVIITLGWILTLAHAEPGLISTESELLSLFQPPKEPVVYAFLGAYVYALGAVLRGYVRKDLRPKSYSHITVRTILAVVLAWVLQLQWSGDMLLGIVFVAGLVPETAIVLIMEWVRKVSALPFLEDEPDPLTKLEGIDLYDRSRLLDEGVASVEGLAHHDLVELMLQTRIPASQLVDWVDQAILYLHAGPGKADDGTGRDATLNRLRAYGIRTATDLAIAVQKDNERRPHGRLGQVLPACPADAQGAPSRIQVIYDVICDEEWMPNLLRWHSDLALHPRGITILAVPGPQVRLPAEPVGTSA